MKILNKPSKSAWWVKKKFTCKCGTRVQLEKGDKVTEDSDRDGSYIKFECPLCKQDVWISSEGR